MGIFQACDIRGIAGQDLTGPLTHRIALAVGSQLAGKDVVVGGDVRLSTPELKQIITEGLAAWGCRVFDIGIVATPVFYYALRACSAAGGVMVTASHNPAPYNGFKLVLGPQPVTEADIAAIARLAAEDIRPRPPRTGTIEPVTVTREYLDHTAQLARPGQLRVVIDAGHGSTGPLAPELFRRLGYEVVELYCRPDGSFPHRPPNPALAENLAALGETVLANHADLGIGFDGDGDRAGFVDENGRAVDNDNIIVLLARNYLAARPGPVIYDAKCSMVVPEEIARAGGRPVMARAGHTFSKAAFLREKALLAGEISGHFFFTELGYDDGMFAGLKVCEYLARQGTSLSRLVAAIPRYILSPDIRVPYRNEDKEAILRAAARTLAGYRPNLIDGVRIEFPDGWGMIRASVTEPLFTLRFEAKTKRRWREIAGILLSALPVDLQTAIKVKMQEIIPKEIWL